MIAPDPFPSLGRRIPVARPPDPGPWRDRAYPPPNRLWADVAPPARPPTPTPPWPARRRTVDALVARLARLYRRPATIEPQLAALEAELVRRLAPLTQEHRDG